MGITKTTKTVAKHCWWPGMRKDIKNYVTQCDDCAMNKSRGGRPMGLLQPVAEPTRPWECVAMDFVGELPVSKGHRYIWTVLDLFSKQAHFIALAKLPSAEKLANLYINHIYKLHGCPSRVVSDRGVQFTAKFWGKFLEMLGAERSMSSAFHPMTNGAVEHTQQTLGQFLRIYSNKRQNDWSRWLAFAELAFNSTIHSATNKSPFEVIYGHEIQPLPQLPKWPENGETGAGKWKAQMQECWDQVTASLKEAHKKYKTFADRKRMEGDKLEKGDLVWEKEALAILKALECWRHFLEGSEIPFEVWSDHKNLQYLKSPRKLSPKQIRWAQYFSRFNFQLKFFQGKQNILADALSRMLQHENITTAKEGTLFSERQWGLAVKTRAQTEKENLAAAKINEGNIWEKELAQSYEGDQWILSNTQKGEQKGGLWFVKRKLYIPAILRAKILHRFHNNQSAGHMGIQKSTKTVAKHLLVARNEKGHKDLCFPNVTIVP
uniref:Gypsy retrotransposon integrase-like protein 1 n=1 Tax=Anolis carolinensis TaxID=28377 RepID=A0A803TPY4_ANOCA